MINYKSTYLRCGRVISNHVNKGFFSESGSKFFLQSVNIWQSYEQECGCFVHFVCLATTLLKDLECGEKQCC